MGQKEIPEMNWERVKERIYPVLLPKGMVVGKGKGQVWHPWMDLAAAYSIRGYRGDGWRMQVWVTEALLAQWGISCEELQRQAMENLRKDHYQIRSIPQILKETFPDSGHHQEMERLPEMELQMQVFTNEEMWNGAAGMMEPGFLNRLGKKGDFYILPSSIHEVILLYDTKEFERESLNEMVRQINEEQVAPQERLADHVYYYDSKNGALFCV